MNCASIVLVALLVVCQITGGLTATPPAGHHALHRPPSSRRAPVLNARALLGNGGFEARTLRPWQSGGSVPPRLVTLPTHSGAYAALIGRTHLGPSITITLTLRLPIPATATGGRLALYA